MTSDTATLAELTARIGAAFPQLQFEKAALIGHGDDNLIVVLDDTWIVRFPRNDEYRGRFAAELNLLAQFAPLAPLPVPQYVYVAEGRNFGAYRKIQGREMTPAVFTAMPPNAQRTVLASLAVFLSTLHALPAETILQPDGTIARTWSGEQFAELYLSTRRAEIARTVSSKTLARFDAFHAALAMLPPGVAKLAHDDLSDDHILVEGSRITGIIDFSDAAFGDPAIDFAWFWRLGEASVERLLQDYKFASDDPALKTRSLWIFVRYMINQLWYGLQGKWDLTPAQTLAELEPHLRRLGF
ncbi:MAG TPA: phosphotransferase [Rhizomicrobium sp.]|nr:phosphotransferase [Rhizomicrobium sp.]